MSAQTVSQSVSDDRSCASVSVGAVELEMSISMHSRPTLTKTERIPSILAVGPDKRPSVLGIRSTDGVMMLRWAITFPTASDVLLT